MSNYHSSAIPAAFKQQIGLSLLLVVLGMASAKNDSCAGEGPAPQAPSAPEPAYEQAIKPILTKHCFACHGMPEKDAKEKRLRLDQLAPAFAGQPGEHWGDVLDMVRSGDMPPKGKPQPTVAERKLLQAWIQTGLKVAGESQQGTQGRVPLRRLNRVEYQNSVRELLAIDTELKDLLPEDNSVAGFDNNADGLTVSTVLMRRYLEAADLALSDAIVRGPRPETIKKKFMSFSYDAKPTSATNSAAAYKLGDNSIFFLDREIEQKFGGQDVLPKIPSGFPMPLKSGGKYRVTISGFGYQTKEPVTLGVYTVDRAVPGARPILIDHIDFKPGEPQIVEFTHRLKATEVVSMCSEGLGGQIVAEWKKNKYKKFPTGEEYTGPGIAVQWVELEGPLFESWPPESHRRLFGDLPVEVIPPEKGAKDKNKAKPIYRVESKQPAADAERLLREFANRAYRQPATEEQLRPILNLVQAQLKDGAHFQDATLLGYQAILCSPRFLYLQEDAGKLASGKLDDFALASRLSYFFWSSLPDRELLDLAAKGKLSEPTTLRQQTERMLKDPKAQAFTENFVGQWLGLRQIEFTLPDERLYPEFDELLQHAMPKETLLFFDELLKHDLSVLNFIDSDFSIINGRLARHYGIDGVVGEEFRKVKLPPESQRGGVLAHASILRLTANGTTTSPVVRGIWVLRNITGRPPAPPPPDVPAVEPDLKGATTIRELLAKHKVKGCADCHMKIDPMGFALESFDVIGGYRDFYRSMGKGDKVNVEIRGRDVSYRKGPPTEVAAEFPNGKQYTDFKSFKRLLLEDEEQIVRCLAEKLVAYATGKEVRAADSAAIESIIATARQKKYGLRSLVHEIVQSPLFLQK